MIAARESRREEKREKTRQDKKRTIVKTYRRIAESDPVCSRLVLEATTSTGGVQRHGSEREETGWRRKQGAEAGSKTRLSPDLNVSQHCAALHPRRRGDGVRGCRTPRRGKQWDRSEGQDTAIFAGGCATWSKLYQTSRGHWRSRRPGLLFEGTSARGSTL